MNYTPLERLHPRRPEDRLRFVSNATRHHRVVDLGAFDETAIEKRDSKYWLHARIAANASEVLGLDTSTILPPDGLQTFPNARILRGGVSDHERTIKEFAPTVVVAGIRDLSLALSLGSLVGTSTAIRVMLSGATVLAATGVAFADVWRRR
jgi:hypothetical protein